MATHDANTPWLTDADCAVDLDDAMTPNGALSRINARAFSRHSACTLDLVEVHDGIAAGPL